MRVSRISRVLIGVAAAALIAGCGVARDGDGTGARPGLEVAPSAGDVTPPTADASQAPRTAAEARPVVAEAPGAARVRASAPEVQELEQPAIWPAADVVFTTPEEAAADFVREVLISDGEPALGDFQQGDSRSGEIAVQFAGEDGTLDPPMDVGLLSLRQLGPSDGWFVIAASSDGANITTPTALATVAAGALDVAGEARGFESTVVVSAFPSGDNSALLDQEIASGGAFADVEPYDATLDLSGATPGEVVVILVQGDSGLGSDPSTFAAIPIVIAQEVIPATR